MKQTSMKRFVCLLLLVVVGCVSSQPHHVTKRLGVSLNNAWTTAAWFIDGANSTGCASDSNTCTSATCAAGGVGPCLTFAEIAQGRWGTYSPRLRQSVVITALSSMPASDPVYLYPRVEGANNLSFVCALGSGQQTWSSTLGTVTAKNRATPQRLQVAMTNAVTGTIGSNQLVVDSTNSSRAWTQSNPSGSNWIFTQPIAPTCVPPSCVLTENDSWTSGDTVVGYTPSSVYIVEALPTTSDTAEFARGTPSPPLWIQQCTIASTSLNSSLFVSNQLVTLVDTLSQRIEQGLSRPALSTGSAQSSWGGPAGSQWANCAINGSYRGNVGLIFAGMLHNQGGSPPWAFGGAFDGDVYMIGTMPVYGSTSAVGNMYVDTNTAYQLEGGFGILGGILWGPGFAVVNGSATLQYPSGAGAAVAHFLQTGGGGTPIRFGNTTTNGTACSVTGATTQTITCGINVTPTNLDAAASASAFGGLAFTLGGGELTNVGQQ